MKLKLQSEKFAATGGMAGEGAKRTLGRPRLGPAELMIREAIQNSCDAKDDNALSVRFSIDAFTLDERQMTWLKGSVFHEVPPYVGLDDTLGRSPLHALVISDRGTVGLAGPTRTDHVDSETVHTNFVEFFRNVGKLERDVVGGGTYGFGKASLYRMSEADTIIAYTRVRTRRSAETRLMAAALGSQYRLGRGKGSNFTGRHWWGKEDTDGIVEPITGDQADRLASILGFPVFDGDETGTSIMVIAPRMAGEGARAIRDLCHSLKEAALWYVWPRMVKGRKAKADFSLSVTCEREPLEIALIEEHPLLKNYAVAYQQAKAATTGIQANSPFRLAAFDVSCHKPIKKLGVLGLTRVFANSGTNQEASADDIETLASIPNGMPSHIALIRNPRMVVRYLSCPPPSDGAGMVGVFVADEELNKVFADAEPVTHDDWNHESLEQRRDRTLVRVTFKRLLEITREYIQPSVSSDAGASDVPLGALSQFLGGLVAASAGTGAEGQPINGSGGNGGSSTGSARQARLEIGSTADLLQRDGQTLARFPMRIKGLTSPAQVCVSVRPFVLTADGSIESESPAGADVPRVVGFETVHGESSAPEGELRVPVKNNDSISVLVSMPSNAAVSIAASVKVLTPV